MDYIDYQEKLDETVQGLPQAAQAVFSKDSVVYLLEEIGGTFSLTFGEIGEMCELVRQIIAKEQPPEGLETRLIEKLDEDNREKAPAIVSQLSEKLFSKLLPALGIKVPIEFAVRVAPPKPELPKTATPVPTESTPAQKVTPPPAPIRPTEPAPLQRMPLPPVSTTPPPARLTPHQTYQGEALISPRTDGTAPQYKPPVMETSHESMAVNPLDSLMQMLEGKVSPKDLSRQFEKLPESLKNALGSVDSAKRVVDIGRKYALHMDKLGELGAETGMVILGFTHPGQFLPRLTKRLGLSEEKVRPIAQEINTEVFLKIREALKMLHGESGEQSAVPIATSPVPIKPSPSKLSSSDAGKLVGQAPKPPLPTSPQPSDLQLSNFKTSEVSDTEELLDREAILRDIENPTPTVRVESGIRNQELGMGPETTDSGMKPTPPPQNNVPIKPSPSKLSSPNFGKLGGQVEESVIPIPKEIPKKIVVPEPPEREIPAVPKMVVEASREQIPVQAPTIPIPAPLPAAPFPPTPEPTVPTKPQSIVEQKLSSPTTSATSESHYSADPYRESL